MTDEQLRELVEKHAKGFAERTKIPLEAARNIVAAAMKDVEEAAAAGRDTKGLYLASLKNRAQGLKVN